MLNRPLPFRRDGRKIRGLAARYRARQPDFRELLDQRIAERLGKRFVAIDNGKVVEILEGVKMMALVYPTKRTWETIDHRSRGNPRKGWFAGPFMGSGWQIKMIDALIRALVKDPGDVPALEPVSESTSRSPCP